MASLTLPMPTFTFEAAEAGQCRSDQLLDVKEGSEEWQYLASRLQVATCLAAGAATAGEVTLQRVQEAIACGVGERGTRLRGLGVVLRPRDGRREPGDDAARGRRGRPPR